MNDIKAEKRLQPIKTVTTVKLSSAIVHVLIVIKKIAYQIIFHQVSLNLLR